MSAVQTDSHVLDSQTCIARCLVIIQCIHFTITQMSLLLFIESLFY